MVVVAFAVLSAATAQHELLLLIGAEVWDAAPLRPLLQAVSSALQVLLLCARAAKLIDGKQLYKAYKTLEAIQRDHGAVLSSSGSGSGGGSNASGGYRDSRPLLLSNSREGTPHKPSSAAVAGALGHLGSGSSSGGGGGAAQLGPLAGFLRERVAELAAALEQRALADFHGWLANVRAQARTIGMRAIRWAASERQQEEALTRQRKLLLPRLEGLGDVRQAGALVAQSLRGPGLREALPPTPLQLPAGGAGTPQSAAAGAAIGGASSSSAASSATPAASSGSTSSSTTAARFAAFKAARQAASSPTRAGPEAGAAAGAGAELSPPGTAGSQAAAAGQTPSQQHQQQQQAGAMQRSDTMQATGELRRRCRHAHMPTCPPAPTVPVLCPACLPTCLPAYCPAPLCCRRPAGWRRHGAAAPLRAHPRLPGPPAPVLRVLRPEQEAAGEAGLGGAGLGWAFYRLLLLLHGWCWR